MNRLSPSTSKPAAAKTDAAPPPAALEPAKKPQVAAPKSDGFADTGKTETRAAPVKLIVASGDDFFPPEVRESIDALLKAAPGARALERGGAIFSRNLIVEVPAADAASLKKQIDALPKVTVTSLDALATLATGKGSTEAKEIASGLGSSSLPKQLRTAQELVSRLQADGPGFLDAAQRGEIASALYAVAGPLSDAFNNVWEDGYSQLATQLRSSLETKGATVDWNVVATDARAELEKAPPPEIATLRAQLRTVMTGLQLLDAPRATALLEQLMPQGRNTGTNLLLADPAAGQKLFSSWLQVAQARIDQADFSAPADTLPKTTRRSMSSGGYDYLAGQRETQTQYQWSADYPFENLSASPVLLFLGENGAKLKDQFVDFVSRNAGKIDAQAAAHRESAVAKETKRIDAMISPEFRAQVGEAAVKKLIDDGMEQYTPLTGNTTLDGMVASLRAGAWATNGSADVQKYLEAVLPLFSQLLEKVKSPKLLLLITDEALAMLSMVKTNRGELPDAAKVDAAAAQLREKLGPFAALADVRDAARARPEGRPEAERNAANEADLRASLELLAADLKQPANPALTEVVKDEVRGQTKWVADIAQHLPADLVAMAKSLQESVGA